MGELAQKYGDVPNVLWQIFMEPWGDAYSWNELKDYSEDLIAHLRQYTDQIIIIPSAYWNQDLIPAGDSPITHDKNGTPVYNLAYACHFYTGANHDQWLRNRVEYLLERNLPVIIAECGDNGSMDDPEWNLWHNFMNKHDLSWCKFSLSTKNESLSSLLPGASVSGGWSENELRISGIKFRNILRDEYIEAVNCNDYVPVSGIKIQNDLLTFTKEGETQTLEYVISPENASNDKVNWISSNEDVACVDQNGKVTAIFNGEANITVKSRDGNFTDTCKLIVEGIWDRDNIAIYKRATASSYSKTNHVAAKAFDGNPETSWESLNKDPQWIYVDLKAYYTLEKIKLRWGNVAGADYKIQISNDPDSEWKDVVNIEGNTSSGIVYHDIDSLTGRYVRLYCTARTGYSGYSLYEMSVYGTFEQKLNSKRVQIEQALIYPNPVSSFLFFDIKNISSPIDIVDTTGKKVATKELAENRINIEEIRPGAYFAIFESDKKKYKIRFIKSK
ncbi:MAG: discoidin domain-containing protein [Prolixibacteraceae bacterium]|nr:discoidin domain-containing protein [Prolixibacteraceae bacterium]